MWLKHLDPRVLIAVASLAGLSVWLVPGEAAILIALLAVIAAWGAGAGRKIHRNLLRGYALFLLFWVGTRFLFGWWNTSLAQAVIEASLHGVRLVALLALGIVLSLIATPRSLGLAFAWFLKPAMRQNAWKAGLAFALMLSFIPRVFRSFTALRRSLNQRCPHLGFYRRTFLLGLSILRVLSLQSWDVAMAVATRNLYRSEPWEYRSG